MVADQVRSGRPGFLKMRIPLAFGPIRVHRIRAFLCCSLLCQSAVAALNCADGTGVFCVSLLEGAAPESKEAFGFTVSSVRAALAEMAWRGSRGKAVSRETR